MSIIGQNILAGASAAGEAYTIDQSLRFNREDAAYLAKTFGSDGSRTTWTLSTWVKVTETTGTENPIIGIAPDSNNAFVIKLYPNLNMYNYVNGPGVVWQRKSSAVYRDVGAWMHVVAVLDTTNGTGDDRAILYVNGARITALATDIDPTEDYAATWWMDASYSHRIGNEASSASFKNGNYLSEFYFIDGQVLTPASFGEINAVTNQWIPKKYAGTYGTNGFYLKFEDSADLGNDSSGNGNDWTVTNLVAADQMLDSPTNNFATFNSLVKPNVGLTYSEGNLKIVATGSWNGTVSTIGSATGKWYMEYLAGTSNSLIGVNGASNARWWDGNGNPQDDTTGTVLYYGYDGKKRVNSVDTAYGDTYANGDLIGIALNLDDSEITFYKNGTVQNSGTAISFPANLISQSLYTFGFSTYSATNYGNFGQDGTFAGQKTAQGNADENGIGNFYYAVPAGYLALCTSNLSDPSIKLPGDKFNTVLYIGTGSSNAVTGVGFQPDLTWIKNRDTADDNIYVDAVRVPTNYLVTNTGGAEVYNDNYVASLDSDGFTVGTGTETNTNTENYVSWNWLAGTAPTADNSAGAGATPTAGSVKIDGSNLGSALAGSIAATRLSANTTSGFSIVSYTGTGSLATVAHGLSEAPKLVIVKRLGGATISWGVGVEDEAGKADFTDYLILNNTDALTDEITFWNDTAPSASVFTINTIDNVNTSTGDYIAYCFHSVEGCSRVGSYSGNAAANGTFIYTGFRPAYFMTKNLDATNQGWLILDSVRSNYNSTNISAGKLAASDNGAESNSSIYAMDLVSNGVKLIGTDGGINAAQGYIYMAFAEFPFKYSNAR